MRWQGHRESDNVEDDRDVGESGPRGGGFRLPGGGFPVGGRGGGMSIGTLVVLGIVLWLLGINPLVLLDGGSYSTSTTGTSRSYDAQPSRRSAGSDELKSFVSTVLASTEDVWTATFAAAGRRYRPTPLVLFSGAIQSACGAASSSSGPFYCPENGKVYIDLAFYDELRRQFDAPGDFAQAYVIAHEVGHHVQDLLGILPAFNAKRRTLSEADANAYSVRIELQADCLAGVWGHKVEGEGWLDTGDLDEALNAATQIGDDAIQKRLKGYVVPESFNHGTSAQRKRWFRRGFDSGDLGACDTLSAKTL